MTATIPSDQLDRFRRLIARRLGLRFDDARLEQLAGALSKRLKATQHTADAYLARLDADASREELTLLAQELTVAETYFFRHLDQYRAFVEVAVPDRLQHVGRGGHLSIVSAGCATGEEPYSLAICIRESQYSGLDNVSILGTDINPALLEKAARGRFSSWVFRETPADIQRRWFRAEGREFVIDESLRRTVRFAACNLAEDDELWRAVSHDIIFCRNVLMYFDPQGFQALIERLARALRPGGYLFLGHAETLRGVSTDFHLRHTHGAFYYQKRSGAELTERSWQDRQQPFAGRRESVEIAAATDDARSWVDAIGQASARVRSLVDPGAQDTPSLPSTAPSSPTGPTPNVALALQLLEQERFTEALDLVTGLPPESRDNTEVLVVRAVLLMHSGQFAMAERTCQRLLEIDEFNAAAHYVLALCREGSGDHAGAVHHDQTAIYLDPTFAMAHLHMGVLARRAHDTATAHREFQQAVRLLQREDATRLLLFGGGFSRDALVRLCGTERIEAGR